MATLLDPITKVVRPTSSFLRRALGADPNDPDIGAAPITLVVYAPFGADKAMSNYSGADAQGSPNLVDIGSCFLVRRLIETSKKNIHVTALIDRMEDCSWQVDVLPGGTLQTVRLPKIRRMDDPWHLANLVQRGLLVNGSAQVVLCLEGHGAGYLPDLDSCRLTEANLRDLGPDNVVRWQEANRIIDFTADGSPILPVEHSPSPIDPARVQALPVLSTWGIARALEMARANPSVENRKLALIHFNNCFNMSVEVLDTVSAHAHFATGYMNYNFFSSCDSYPNVFSDLRANPQARVSDLAILFAEKNRATLDGVNEAGELMHPTVCGVVALNRMPGITQAIDAFAKDLISALPCNVELIQDAMASAQQYDTGSDGSGDQIEGWKLEVPDQLTDIRHFAKIMSSAAKSVLPNLSLAAQNVYESMSGIKQYGDVGNSWVADGKVKWDFQETTLAMNIFCPDPRREGLWDWRAPYYLLQKSNAQPNVIPFLQTNAWVPFIVKYHQQVKFEKYLKVDILRYPVKKPH